jgi:hypothetical protein
MEAPGDAVDTPLREIFPNVLEHGCPFVKVMLSKY